VNRAVTAALQEGQLIADNPFGEAGVKPRTFRTRDQPTVILRQLGPRDLVHIPPTELAKKVQVVAGEVGWDASSLLPVIARRYGIRQVSPAGLAWLDSTFLLASPKHQQASQLIHQAATAVDRYASDHHL
jgi:hypothetical protein